MSDQVASATRGPESGRSRLGARVVIVGPTASGKSDFGLAVVTALRGLGREAEVVSMDSMCVYRGMDVGTAKPELATRTAVAHHLLDLVDPDEEFSVADFQRRARVVLTEIAERGHVAVLVGGTGLYVDAVVDDLQIPGQYPAVKAELEAEVETDGGCASLYERLLSIDPIAASRMEPTNVRRIVRALEVTLGSGRPFSSYGPGLRESQQDRGDGGQGLRIGLRWPRPELASRIDARLEVQLRAGFVDEAAGVFEQFGDRISRTAGQALGYRELWAHLRGETTLVEALAATALRTRQFAVRQERWFRRDPRIRWIDGSAGQTGAAGADGVVGRTEADGRMSIIAAEIAAEIAADPDTARVRAGHPPL